MFNAECLSKANILIKIKILNGKAENIILNQTILKGKKPHINCFFYIIPTKYI